MFILANLLSALAQLVGIVLNIYMWIIIIRAIVSWVSPDPYNPFVQLLHRTTEPVLQPIRRALPVAWGIDFSPVVAILAIIFLDQFLVASLRELAWRFR